MRTLMIASAAMALIAADGASAQQRIVQHGPGATYGMPGRGPMTQPMRPGPVVRPMPGHQGPRPGYGQPHQPRWGSKVGGRWWGGANAPGGWGGYRRPYRGWALPSYWIAPRFYITDWSGYGLSQPGSGYNWTRYYDDAVLVDSRGSVYDSVGGLDWDRFDGAGYDGSGNDGGYYANDDQVYAGPNDRGYAYDDGRQYDGRQYDGRQSDGRGYQRRDNGLGGAAVGAVVGGVAGNVIAGRGNRLGGTLIGAGVGAAAGYAIDKNEDRGRRAPPPPPPVRYAPAPAYGAGYAHPGPGYAPPRGGWVSPDGGTTVTTTGGGYGSTTTIVVQSAPVVTTTTTTEYYDDGVTYIRPAPRKVWKKRVIRARPRCTCG